MEIKYGATRIVILIGKYAIKVPTFDSWHLFLMGLLGNMAEIRWSNSKLKGFCPIVFYIPGGWVSIMRRAAPLSHEEFFLLDFERWVNRGDYIIPVENKLDSFGILDGEVVAVDYG